MEEEIIVEEEQGISFGRIVKVAFGRWKLLLIIIACFTVVGFFAIYFGYNRLFNTYKTTFSYSGSGLASEVMADNTTFNYKSLISKKTLNEVKASKEEYSTINVDELLKSNSFTINRSVDKDSGEISYTISIKRNKMPNVDITRDFFSDLANYPLGQDKAYISESTFDSALKKIESIETFEEEIDLLSTQASTLISGYNAISGLSISTTIRDEISSNIYTINNLIDGSKASLLKNMVINYGLAPDYTKIDVPHLTEQKNVLTEEKTNNTALIEEIKAQIKDLGESAKVTSLGERMESLIVRNNTIDQEVKKVNRQIDNYNKPAADVEGHAQFVKDTKKIYDGLYTEIGSYKNVMNKVYVENAEVTFNNTNVVDITNTMSVVYSILIPAAVGLVVGLIVNLIVDRKKLTEDPKPVEEKK